MVSETSLPINQEVVGLPTKVTTDWEGGILEKGECF